MDNPDIPKYALLGTAGCKKILDTIEYLRFRNCQIPMVIFETEIRSAYTPTQIEFKYNHLCFIRDNAGKMSSRLLAYLKLAGLSCFLFTPMKIRTPLLFTAGKIRSWFFSRQLSRRGVCFFHVQRISSEMTKSLLLDNQISWAFLASSQWILTSVVLSSDFHIVNFHPGILPRHRSLDSFFWSILEMDGIGVSAHLVDQGIDTGPIVKRFFILPYPMELMKLRETADLLFPVHLYTLMSYIQTNNISLTYQEISEGKHHRPMNQTELCNTEKILQNHPYFGECKESR